VPANWLVLDIDRYLCALPDMIPHSDILRLVKECIVFTDKKYDMRPAEKLYVGGVGE